MKPLIISLVVARSEFIGELIDQITLSLPPGMKLADAEMDTSEFSLSLSASITSLVTLVLVLGFTLTEALCGILGLLHYYVGISESNWVTRS